jgi:hypothetical protein
MSFQDKNQERKRSARRWCRIQVRPVALGVGDEVTSLKLKNRNGSETPYVVTYL